MDNKTKLLHGAKRRDYFTAWTQKIIDGEVVTPPLHMKKEERRQYIREVLREDHAHRIANSPTLIKKLLEDSLKSRMEFLDTKITKDRKQFVILDEIVPHSTHS